MARVSSKHSPREDEQRVALSRVFPPDLFPAGRDRLVEQAAGLFADAKTLAELRRLPDRSYTSVGDVWSEIEASQADTTADTS